MPPAVVAVTLAEDKASVVPGDDGMMIGHSNRSTEIKKTDSSWAMVNGHFSHLLVVCGISIFWVSAVNRQSKFPTDDVHTKR